MNVLGLKETTQQKTNMLKKTDAQTEEKILDAENKSGVFYSRFVKYLIGFFAVLCWTVIVLLLASTLGRPIISGYVLLFILAAFFREIKIVLFMGALVFLSYSFLFFAYPHKMALHPFLDIAILFVSVAAVVLIVRGIQRHYANLIKEKNKTKTAKESLETMVAAKIKELQELSGNLEVKAQERTKTLEATRKALMNLLEDAEESKKEIELEKNKTRAALVSLTDGLIVFDKEKKIVLVNPEAERVLEIKEKEVLNKKINQISASANLNKLYDVLGGKIEWTGQRYELILGKQLKRFFQVSITPISVGKETIGLMVILHDVTRGKEVERLKTEFVSIAAHQLRTPLSATKWILKMLLDGDIGKLSKEQIDFLEKGYQSNERMITLINDLLNVAHIEEGRFIYRPSLDLLEDVAQRSIDGLKDAAKKRDVEIVFNKPKNRLLKKVKIDGKKIELVIQNLLDNALRFTKPGGRVAISVEYGKINAKVIVRDTGVGIPDKQQSRIFTKFFRADNVIKMETEGSGLGLFICKNIISAHHGKIWFESEENKGTTFYFTIPLNSKL